MTEELTIPGWVNSAYHGYHANRLRYMEWEEDAMLEEEREERLTTPLDLVDYRGIDPRTPGYVNSIEEDTRVMRREDWVDRTHRGSRLAALGPALVALVAIFSFVLIVIAVVWFGAAWIDHLTPFQF